MNIFTANKLLLYKEKIKIHKIKEKRVVKGLSFAIFSS